MLGVSPDAWRAAVDTMGKGDAAIAIAAILQRADAISSPGGYLRALTAKAGQGAFATGPVVIAQLKANLKSRAPRSGDEVLDPARSGILRNCWKGRTGPTCVEGWGRRRDMRCPCRIPRV